MDNKNIYKWQLYPIISINSEAPASRRVPECYCLVAFDLSRKRKFCQLLSFILFYLRLLHHLTLYSSIALIVSDTEYILFESDRK